MPEFTMADVASHLEGIADRVTALDLALAGVIADALPALEHRALAHLVDDIGAAVARLAEEVEKAADLSDRAEEAATDE